MKTLIFAFLFVVLYGSGFVAAKVGLSYSDPLSFLVFRFSITATLLVFVCLAIKAPWPKSLKELMHIAVAGTLIVGTFSAGAFISIDMGTPAATTSLIISLQPLIASLLSFVLLKTAISRSQWFGLVLGLAGVSFLVLNKLGAANIEALLMSVVGLLGLTFGSLYQKHFCSNMNIFTGGVIHTSASALLCVVLMLFYPSLYIEWHPEFIAALLWMSVVVSIGALSMLYVLIRTLEISQVSSLFYLTPVSSVLFSVLLLDQSLDQLELLGIVLTSLSVFMVNSHYWMRKNPVVQAA